MSNRKYVVEFVVFMTYALFAMSWVAGSLMTKDIMAYYGIESLASATWTTNAITLAKIIGNLLAAWFLVRLGIKKAFAFASILIVAGVVGIFATQYPLYVVSRLIMGLGGALVIVYFNPIVVRYFEAGDRPLVNGINAAAFNTGNLLALLLTASLLSWLSRWQDVIVAVGACSLIVLVIFWLVMEDFPLDQKNAGAAGAVSSTADYTLSDGMKDPINWWLPFTYSGLLFCYIAVFSLFPLVPTFAVPASRLSSIFIASGMAGTVGAILITKKYPLRIPVIRYSGLCMTLCAALMIYTSIPAIAYISACLAGFLMFLPMTGLITLGQELPDMTPKRVTVIFSMFWSISYAIETVLMYIAGLLSDMTGNVWMAAVFAVICSSTFFIGSFFLPETGKRPVEESV